MYFLKYHFSITPHLLNVSPSFSFPAWNLFSPTLLLSLKCPPPLIDFFRGNTSFPGGVLFITEKTDYLSQSGRVVRPCGLHDGAPPGGWWRGRGGTVCDAAAFHLQEVQRKGASPWSRHMWLCSGSMRVWENGCVCERESVCFCVWVCAWERKCVSVCVCECVCVNEMRVCACVCEF